MCNPTVCFLSLSTTSTGVDSLIEQTDGWHLKLFGLRLWCLFYEEKCVPGMLFSRGTNLVCTPARLSAVSKCWGIEGLCIRSTRDLYFYGEICSTKFGCELRKCCHYLPVYFGFCHVDEAEQLQKLLVMNSLVISLFC